MNKPLRPCNHYGCKTLVKNGYCLEHRKAHSDRLRASTVEARKRYDERRGSARERGYDTHWDKFRVLYLRRNPLCIKCGERASLIHHIVPLCEAGEKIDEDNLQSLCVACHNKIHHHR